jgi:hypothetical protein
MSGLIHKHTVKHRQCFIFGALVLVQVRTDTQAYRETYRDHRRQELT